MLRFVHHQLQCREFVWLWSTLISYLVSTCFLSFFQNSKSVKGQIRYLVYCMENAVQNLPPGEEQMVWMIDFHGYSLANVSLRTTKETAHVLQEHYPERLAFAVLYNPPKFFEPFWKVKPAGSSLS